MSNNDDNDVLKRLRDVRKKLQESLTDQGSDVQRKEESKIELVDAQHEIEKEDKARQIQKEVEQAGTKGPKLFKTDADSKATVSDKAFKESMGVSRKRMASIQRRIKEKVESRRRMTPRQRMGLVVGILFAVVPLLFTNVLAFASCRFNFDGIEVEYRDTAGWLQISLPVENPTFVSAKIGVISFSLYDRFTEEHVGSVTANVNEEIAPYETKIIDLDVFLDPATAGKWIENTINEFKISLVIRNFKYNGVTLVSDIAIPEVDLSPLIESLLGGLDIEGMMGDMSAESQINAASIPKTLPASASIADVNAAWEMAQQKPVNINSENGGSSPQAAADDVMEILGIGVGENEEKFAVTLDLALSLPKIEKMDLGPIRIMKLNASLYAPSKENAKTQDDYTNRLATLSSLDPVTDGVVTDFSDFDNIRGIYRNGSYPVEVNLGGVGFIGARLELFKDNIQGAAVHPSANLDITNKTLVNDWAEANKLKYPTWYFFYYLLNNGSINVAIRLEELSLEIFGVKVYNIQIDKNLIPPLHLKNILNVEKTLTDLLVGSKPIGFFGMIGFLTETISTMGLNIPKTAVPLSSGIETKVNLDDASSMLGDLSLDNLMAGIKETIGVNISLGLGIEIINTLIDLHLGLSNVTLSISSDIVDPLTLKTSTKNFATAFLSNEVGSRDIYINGLGSRTMINLNLTLFTDKERTPFVEQFLRDLVENYTLKGTATLSIGKLVLFAENYTWAGINLAIRLESLMDLIGEEGLESLLADLIRDALSGLSDPTSMFGSTSEPRETNKISINNPLMAPVELLSQIAFGTPFLSPVSGYSFSNMYIKDDDGSLIKAPKSAQEIHIYSNEVERGSELTIVLIGLELEAGTIPIHIGIGYTYIEIQTNSTNEYGSWKGLLGLTISDYVDLGPETTSLDLTIKLSLYPSSTLCNFFDNVMTNRTDPTCDLRITGSLTLNFSGAFIPNLNLDLKVPEVALALDIQGLMDGLIGGMSAVAPGTAIIGPQRNLIYEDEGWWDGDYSKLPFMSQSFDIGELFEIGSFGISGFAETGWPHYDQGHVILDILLPLRNNLMSLELINVSVKLYDMNDNQIAAIYLSDVPNKFSDTNYIRMNAKQEANLYMRLELIKGMALQNWLNTILTTLNIQGRLVASLTMGVFGCKIGPLTINSSLGPMLESLGLDLTSLLGVLIPFNNKIYRDSPRASQDMMDLFGNFGLAYVTAEKKDGAVSPINPVGECNFTDPMMTFIAGLILAPAFNMSILEADLYLCDKNIYDRINLASGSQAEALKYSKMAGISMDPFPVYANNTFDPKTDFNDPHVSYLGLTSSNYYEIVDPDKPYLDPANYYKGVDTMQYAQVYNSSGQPIYESYQEMTNRLYHGTFAMTELRLSLYNISHGSYATAYPKKYWKAMGGPYFPVQVYDSAHGGWPNHKYVYHPNFAPIATLLSNVGAVLDDPMSILSKVTIGGNITINIFSMNITLDASAPVVQDLLTSITAESMNYMYDEIKKSWDITQGRQTPDTAYYERAQRVATHYDDPSIPRLATAPLNSEFFTDLSIDMESLINNYAYFGLDNRNDHIFSPAMYGPTGNGIQYMNNSRDMGSNWNPWEIDIYGIKSVKPGYRPGLVEFGGQNRERFVKDQFYEQYKIIVENWAISRKMLYNPFFESENLSTWVLDDNGIHFDKIANPQNWALRWYDSKYERPGPCRQPTMAAIFPLPVVPAFEFGILSAFISMWYDDAAASGRECGALAPIGYIFVNNSIFPRLQGSLGDRFFEDNYYSRIKDEYGNVYQDGSWVMANLRLFDCPSTKNFIGGLVGGDIINGEISFRFVLEATANVSLFGYEAYNLAVPQLPMGDPAGYTQRCTWNALTGSGASAWGNIAENGSVISDPQPPTVEWVPEYILPKFDSETWGIQFDTDSILGSITDDILGFLTDHIRFSYEGGLSFGITITGFQLTIPIILSLWLTMLKGMIWINAEDDTAEWWNTPVWNWGYHGSRPDIDLAALNAGWWTELNLYYPYDDPANNMGRPFAHLWNTNPYNIAGNCQSWSPNYDRWSTYYGEAVTLPDVKIVLDLGHLGWPLLEALLFGSRDHLWMTATYDVNALAQLLAGMPAKGIVACILVPSAFGYDSFMGPTGINEGIVLPSSLLTMDLAGLL